MAGERQEEGRGGADVAKLSWDPKKHTQTRKQKPSIPVPTVHMDPHFHRPSTTRYGGQTAQSKQPVLPSGLGHPSVPAMLGLLPLTATLICSSPEAGRLILHTVIT